MVQEAIQYLPVDQIDCNPQIRVTFAQPLLIGLARSIQEVGLQQPAPANVLSSLTVNAGCGRRVWQSCPKSPPSSRKKTSVPARSFSAS
jgi:hypothetical protein